MRGARDDILSAVRGALANVEGADQSADGAEAHSRIAGHPSGPVPTRGRLGLKARVDLFIREAERVNATVARVSGPAAVPRELSRYLAGNNLGVAVTVAPDLAAPVVPWSKQTLLEVSVGTATGTEHVGVSRAFAAVAETGTLVLASGPGNPTMLNFLPPTHVAVVAAQDIAGDYETVWARLRAERMAGDTGAKAMPRTVNWITGPSRTADIEQTLLLGAHGPQRLHIVIVDDEIPSA